MNSLNQINPKSAQKLILIAEDDKYYANLYNTKLTKIGFEVKIADDGNALIKIAQEKKPDLILLDLIMPHKDGFETLSDLKKDPTLKNVKVIVVSNLGQEEDIKKVKELGAEDYLIKTNISIQNVVDKILELIK